ncbi:MAG UNVERIFIED_CONTAM: hypothetical protein LVR18_36215 [Planctomycetaceae bacterium]
MLRNDWHGSSGSSDSDESTATLTLLTRELRGQSPRPGWSVTTITDLRAPEVMTKVQPYSRC